MISKIVKRVAVAAATLGVAGGALFATGGSASAATLPADAGAAAPRVVAYTHGDHQNSYRNSDRYDRYDRYGHYDHGHGAWHRYHGHRFHRHHGTWTEWTHAGFHHYAI
ncbi:hypothetical protein [Streptomyces chiangmaiensis]|uniref:Uncharacterized protein n=1 Tax=Streptomyces chiangmaiensis TaxID=766497 RepID=A0ABU7FXA6_9ACTN|nr:hypothetical protein [Streptomyces chiangmaiensis]MED7828717.1 hypothetical protein [Streptomyces chiangmaiensis]